MMLIICTVKDVARVRVMSEKPAQTFSCLPEMAFPGRQPTSGRPNTSWHVYGSQAALCVEADRTRGGGETVAVEGALATAPRTYDWSGKIRVQLTAQELPLFAAALLGYLEIFEAANHGDQGKGLTLTRQPDRGVAFVRVVARGVAPRAVAIQPGDLFHVTAIVLGQLILNHPALPYPAVSDLLRSVAALRAPQNRPENVNFSKNSI